MLPSILSPEYNLQTLAPSAACYPYCTINCSTQKLLAKEPGLAALTFESLAVTLCTTNILHCAHTAH